MRFEADGRGQTQCVATILNCRVSSKAEMSFDVSRKARARDKRNPIVQALARVLAAARHLRLMGPSTMTASKRIAVGNLHSCRHRQLSRAILSSSINRETGLL